MRAEYNPMEASDERETRSNQSKASRESRGVTRSNTIIAGVFTLVAGLLSALVTHYGISVFWEPGETIILSGHPVTSKLIDRQGNVSDYPIEGITEHYDSPSLTIRGERATFEANYTAKRNGEIEVNGKITATGRLENGTAYLTYRIRDSSKSQEWSGVLMLYIPPMGDLSGYYMVESSDRPGHTALGYVKLSRIRSVGP